MEQARGAGLPFAVVTHLNATNLGELERMHDLVLGNGAYAWQVQLGTEMGNLADHPEMQVRPRDLPAIEARLGRVIASSPLRIHASDSLGYFGPNERLLRKGHGGTCFGGCPAGIRVVGVESNGNVKGCLSIMAGYNERGAEFVEGNVREEPLPAIWNREGAFAYTRERTVDDLTGPCADCPQAARCHGGCTAKKVASGGGTQNPMCVLRVLRERELPGRRAAGRAAAAVLAGFLGAGAEGCYDATPAYGLPYDGGPDGDADSDTDTDTGTDSDTGTGTDVSDYGIPDTDTGGDDYGIPDTDTSTGGDEEYGIPDTDTQTETSSDTGVDAYGMPDA